MRLRFFFGLILALLLLFTSPPARAASSIKGMTRGIEILYEADRLEKGALPGQSLQFSHLDFLPCCGETQLNGILLEKLPSLEAGNLVLAGQAVTAGSWIPAEMIQKLSFVPTGTEAFQTELVFSLEEGGPSRTMLLTFDETETEEVVSTNLKLTTFGNVALFANLPGEGENLSFVITESPQKGVIQLDKDSGAFVYHPARNQFGTDYFRYYIRNSRGNRSEISTVKIQTVSAPQNLFFRDCAGEAFHNAAIQACANGVLSYSLDEDGLPLFRPEEEVSWEEVLQSIEKTSKLPEKAQAAFSAPGSGVKRREAAVLLEAISGTNQSPQRSAKILAFNASFSARASSLRSDPTPPAYFKQMTVSAGKEEKPSSLPRAVFFRSRPL